MKEFPHIADQMKSIARKRDKINKQAMEDVSLLLKTAKEITFEKNSNTETLKNSMNEKKINGLTVQEQETGENPVNESKSFNDAVFKFKSKLNKNKIAPEPQSVELSLQKKIEVDNSKSTLKANKEDEFDKRKKNYEIDDKSQSESQSSSSSASEKSEKNHGFLFKKIYIIDF